MQHFVIRHLLQDRHCPFSLSDSVCARQAFSIGILEQSRSNLTAHLSRTNSLNRSEKFIPDERRSISSFFDPSPIQPAIAYACMSRITVTITGFGWTQCRRVKWRSQPAETQAIQTPVHRFVIRRFVRISFCDASLEDTRVAASSIQALCSIHTQTTKEKTQSTQPEYRRIQTKPRSRHPPSKPHRWQSAIQCPLTQQQCRTQCALAV